MNIINKFLCFCLLGGVLLVAGCGKSIPVSEVVIVPQPLSLEKQSGSFLFNAQTVVVVPDVATKFVAETFTSLFTASAGFTPLVKIGGEGNVVLTIDKAMKSEAYELQITSKKIIVKSADAKGFFYALQSLRLMLPPAIEGNTKTTETWSVPAVTIKDEPRFGYRGFMLDVSRYFLPKDDLIRLIDCIGMLKINRLHLHLTDDNGWRLEIKKYPRLTEVGAWRVDRQNLPFPDRRNPVKGESTSIGGYYTQNDMKEIITYAAERQIEIIPEIDIPAHSISSLAAYPEYACPVVKDFIGVLPGLGGKNAEIIYCAGNDKTFDFLQDVLDEVMALFPSSYMHLGGDEATKTNWKKCPLCQARIRKEHLKDEEALQGYFMGRISDYVRSKGKQVLGWDELTNSKLPENAIIMGWQGYGRAALKAAEQGHRFIMTPARLLYLIRYQGPQWFEPVTYFGNNTLKNVFDYEPVQDDWKPEYENLLMGVQACMWTEFCNKPEDVFYLTFPRLAALAETAWVPKSKKDWESFLKALDAYNAHLLQKGIVPARSMYNIQHTVLPNLGGKLEVHLECERPDMEIRYTLDGTDPTPSSMLYTENIVVDKDVIIKAVTFSRDVQMGKVLELPLRWNLATAKPLLNAPSGVSILVNGLRGSLKQSDFEWYTGELSKPISFTIDLMKSQQITECTVGCLTNYGMAAHKPKSMLVEVSEDNVSFIPVGKLTFADNEIFREGNFIEDLKVSSIANTGRYVRFTFEIPGDCPDNHVRPGQPSRVYLDEVVIR